jgi:hypothetical protein
LTPRLSLDDGERLWTACINTRTTLDVSDNENRLRLLLDLIPHLPEHSKRQALQAALSSVQAILFQLDDDFLLHEIENNRYRSEATTGSPSFLSIN